jgi:hypothetical protein
MSIQLYAFTCATMTGESARLMEGGKGDLTIPVPVFRIEHSKGRARFDTGLHPDCRRDPEGRLGRRLAPGSRSALLRARRSARGSQRSAATRRGSMSSSIRISISAVSAATLTQNATMLV